MEDVKSLNFGHSQIIKFAGNCFIFVASTAAANPYCKFFNAFWVFSSRDLLTSHLNLVMGTEN
jgi:hypothetical protein